MSQVKTNATDALFFVGACLLAVAPPTFAAGTAFTYQGELTDGDGLANGSYGMAFSLWNAPNSGAPIGSAVNLPDVSVTDGRFTVELDFGADAFDNTGRWLQITVDGFTLSPRQPITRAPYSIQTRGIFVDDQNNVGIGTDTPESTLHVMGLIMSDGPGGGSVGARNPNNPSAGVFLSWHNDVARLRIAGEGPGAAGGLDIQKTNDRSLMRLTHGGWLGLGTTAPDAKLHVHGSDASMRLSTVGNAFGPELQFRNSTSSNSAHGTIEFQDETGSVLGNIAYVNPLFGPSGLSFQTAGGGLMKMTDGGNVGIGTTTPDTPLHVEGGGDTEPGYGGYLVLGNPGGPNISIDNNEIMARNNGGTSTLYLNNDGGDIVCGGSLFVGHTVVSQGGETVACPAGTVVLGGGCRISGDAEIRESYPLVNGWRCIAGDIVGFPGLTAYAICADIR